MVIISLLAETLLDLSFGGTLFVETGALINKWLLRVPTVIGSKTIIARAQAESEIHNKCG